jgi:alpha-ketoglutarate-dependent taurine dioxygenase
MNVAASFSNQDLQLIGNTPLLLEVDTAKQKVTEWAEQNKDAVEALLRTNGAVLIRGLKILSSTQFGKVLPTLFGEELIEYKYRSTPRTELRNNIYTTTEYHADMVIPQHNENAYANNWAMRIGFLCMLPSQTGGETPICDSRKIYQKIPKQIRDEFEAKKVCYVRNYSDIDLPWTEVFQTEDRSVVEGYCKHNNLEFEWLDNNGLRTKQVNNASAVHPVTGEMVWFNQAHLFHISSLDAETRQNLIGAVGEEHLPRNSYFGDGSPIDIQMLEEIRKIYVDSRVIFPWQKHDLLLMDNMLYAHGRNPYSGERKVLVGMARPFSNL